MIDMNSMCAVELGEAVLNVLAIIGIVCFSAFVIVFLCDLILSISGNRDGIFFKQKDNTNDRQVEKEQEREFVYVQNEENELLKERIDALEAKQSAIDFEKAEQEERELREKLALEKQEEIDEITRENEDRVADLEERNAELLRLLEEKDKEEVVEKPEMIYNFLEDVNEEEDDFDDIIMAFNKMNEEKSQVLANEESEDVVFEDEQPVEEISFNEEAEIVEPTVEESKTANSVKDDEYSKTLSDEIESLKKELAEQRAELEQAKQEAKEREEALIAENAQLAQNLEDVKQQQEQEQDEILPIMLTRKEYEERLEVLTERLKENDKQLRKVKKEYRPLAKVVKTLERDKAKLRRREAMVAKQKVVLYGVNNYIDIDEEKAQKLSEDLDLLDGLRLSVQHCEEVMENNKERYPILEQTYNILTANSEQINADIAQLQEDMARLDALEITEEENVVSEDQISFDEIQQEVADTVNEEIEEITVEQPIEEPVEESVVEPIEEMEEELVEENADNSQIEELQNEEEQQVNEQVVENEEEAPKVDDDSENN